MDITVIIALVFFIAFLLESVFGFGGLIISFTVLSFFMETRDMIFLGLYVSVVASAFVIISDHTSFSKKIFLSTFPIALAGALPGALLFSFLSNIILLKVFAIVLLIFSVKSLLFDKINVTNALFQKIFLLMGGFLQGLFGTGGPFTVMAIKDKFAHKSQLRTTMALFFIVFNLIRAVQLAIQNSFDATSIITYWWLALVLPAAIYLGYKIHLKFNEYYFKLGINVL